MANNQSIEFQVTLGLQGAQGQVEQLRKMLQESVKVDSSAFKDIERFLNKIASQTDGLKGKMGEAFKTSASSKQFLKQYEQLFGMLEAAKDKFTSLGLNDIAFSASDQKQVDEAIEKIKQLQTEISNLEKGKVGNLFSESSLEGAEKVQAFIDKLKASGQDVGKLTFSSLSATVAKELKTVDETITKTEERINSLKQQINSLSGNQLDDLTKKMQEAIAGATDASKSTFKTENILEYRKALEDFYQTYQQYSGERNIRNDTTGSVSTWMKNEAQSIADGIQKMKEKFNDYQNALKELEHIKADSSLTGATARQKVQNVADLLGISFDANSADYKSYIQALVALRDRIKEEFKGITDTQMIDDLGKNMLENLTHIFDEADLNKVVNTTNLKKQLESIFKELNLDLSDSNITQIFNAITANLDIEQFVGLAINSLESLREKQEQVAKEAIEQNEKQKQSREDLKSVENTVTNADTLRTDSIKEKLKDIEAARDIIQSLIDKVNQANGTHFKLLDDAPIKQGQAALESYINTVTKFEQKQKTLSNVQMAVNRWMGFWQVLNMTKSAINDMKQHIQELDTVMTKIAVVTNFSQGDLWGQIGQYSEIARQYGVAIKGVYEVSQIYYQQGLQQNDVMTLTTETLKMARIAGLDYATAADYMTTAIRGFKMEMSEASHVTDVFSALAATTASSTEEIAVAISKTAASAANVGASFEATSAMMATMIATTRESATNIGTALKSIISRYGEMKEQITGTDAEGEEFSLNKVDKALQTIGVTIHTTTGEFRNFDDVIMELAEKWDTLDSVSQRYIATVMAGNRQQSRFLALVSNVEEYKKALETAMNAEGAGELQTLKTLDSIDAKIEKMKVTIQEFYTSSGIEQLYKNILETITNVISSANSLPKVFGKIPLQALAIGGSLVLAIKNILGLIIGEIQASLEQIKNGAAGTFEGLIAQAASQGNRWAAKFREGAEKGFEGISTSIGTKLASKLFNIVGAAITGFGAKAVIEGFNDYGKSMEVKDDEAAAIKTRRGAWGQILGNTLTGVGTGLAVSGGNPIGAIAGGLMGAVSGIVANISTLISAHDMYNASLSRQVELSQKRLEAAKTEEAETKNETKQLENAYNKLIQLQQHQYDSVEAQQELTEYMNQLGDSYSAYIQTINANGDVIIDAIAMEQALAAAREDAAQAALRTIEAEKSTIETQQSGYKTIQSNLNQIYTNHDLYYLHSLNGYKTSTFNPGNNVQGQWRLLQYAIDNLIIRKSNPAYDKIMSRIDEGGFDFAKEFPDLYEQSLRHYATHDKGLKSEYGDTSVTDEMKQYLKKQIDDLLAMNPNLKLDVLSNNLITDTQQILSFDGQNFLNLYDTLQNNIAKIINQAEENLNTINTAIIRASTNEAIQSKITQLQTEGNENEKKQGEQLQKYLSLMAFILNSDIVPDEEEINNIFEYILSHQKEADRLQQLDYSQYKGDTSEIDLPEELNKYAQNFYNEFDRIRSEAIKGLDEQINNLNTSVDVSELLHLFKTEEGHENTELITSLIPSFRAGITKYNELLNNGLPATAMNYYKNFSTFFNTVSTLSLAQQSKIAPIVANIDFSDYSSVLQASDQLNNLGIEFSDLAKNLQDAAKRFSVNAGLILEQVAESVVSTTEAIETAINNQSKTFKQSEALKNAEELLTEYDGLDVKELTWKDLYEYNDEVKGYIETEKAFTIRLQNATKNNQKMIAQAESALQQENNIFSGIQSSTLFGKGYYGAIDFEKRQKFDEAYKKAFQSQTHISNKEIDAAWEQYQKIVEEFNNSDETDFLKFFADRINKTNSKLKQMIEENQNLAQDLSKDTIKSFDYSSIVGGTFSIQSKNNLKTYLKAAVGDNDSLQRNIDKYYESRFQALSENNIEVWNNWLKNLGLEDLVIPEPTQAELDRVKFQQILTAISELGEKKAYQALSKSTQQLLKDKGITFDNYKKSDIPAIITEYLNAIQQLIDAGAGTISEITEPIKKLIKQQQEAAGIGKQKKLLDAASDQKFTVDELVDLNAIDKNKKLQGDWANILYENPITGEFEFKAEFKEKSVEDQLAALAKAMNIMLITADKSYIDARDNLIKQHLEEINKDDFADTLKTLSTTQSGTIDLKGIPQKYLNTLEGVSGTLYEVTSEATRDQWILGLQLAEDATQKQKDTLLELQKSILAKRNKTEGFKGILSETVSRAFAEKFVESIGLDKSEAEIYMKMFGFSYDFAKEEYKMANANVVDQILDFMQNFTFNTDDYLDLTTQANNIKFDLTEGKQNSAIADLLTHYQYITPEELNAFYKAIGEEKKQYFEPFFTKLENDNAYEIKNISGFIEQIENTSLNLNQNAQNSVLSFITNYQELMNNASQLVETAGSPLEIGSFMKSYNTLFRTDALSKDELFVDGKLQADMISTIVAKLREKVGVLLSVIYGDIFSEEEIDNMFNLSFIEQINKTNWESFAADTNTEEELEALRTALIAIGRTPEEAETIIKEAKEGVYDTLEGLNLSGLKLSEKTKKAGETAEANQYVTAINELLTEGGLLSDQTKVLLEKEGIDYSGIQAGSKTAVEKANSLLESLNQYVTKELIAYSTQIELSDKIEQQKIKNQGFGKAISALNMIADGKLEVSEITSLISNWGGQLTDWIENGQLQGEIAKVLTIDDQTGAIIAQQGKTAEEILDAIITQTNSNIIKGSNEYIAALSQLVNSQISMNETDIDGMLIKALQSLSSQGINTEFNASVFKQAFNLETFKDQFDALGIDINSDIWKITSEEQRESLLLLLDFVVDTYNSSGKELVKAVSTSLKKSISTSNKYIATKDIISQSVSKDKAKAMMIAFGKTNITQESMEAFMTQMGFEYDQWTEEFKAGANIVEGIDSYIEKLRLADVDHQNEDKIRELEAALQQLGYDLTGGRQQNAITDLLQNYTNYSFESYEKFMQAFPAYQDQLASYFTKTDKGYDVDLQGIITFFNENGIVFEDAIKSQLAGISDNYISNIQKAVSLVSKGTTSMADMETFVQNYNKLFPEETATITQLFDYNSLLKSWTLDPTILQKFVQEQAKGLGLSGDELNEFIEDQTKSILAQNVDISSFLNAEDRTRGGEAYKTLAEAMYQYYESIGEAENAGRLARQSIGNLKKGGESAVKEVKKWAQAQEREATSEELSKAFSYLFDEYSNVVKSLADTTRGSFVTGKLREVLQQLGMVDANGIINEHFNMAEAYKAIYEQMKNTAGATISGLNDVYAELLTAEDQQNIDTLEILKNADGMTYDVFAKILTRYSKSLEETLSHSFVESTGFGKVRIIDFDRFANYMNFDLNSPEYAEAYNSYIDSMIKLQQQPKTMLQNFANQLKDITKAKPGDLVNVSYIAKQLGWEQLDFNLAEKLRSYGASYADGILKLSDGANIAGLINDIANEAAQAGQLLPEQLAELADAVSDMISSITSLIKSGITGSLTNTKAQSLDAWARQHGFTNGLNFTSTTEGLKLSTVEAIKLYNTIKEIDSLQGQIVFDELNKSLEENNEHYKSITDIMSRIVDLNNKIGDEKVSDARREQYKAELELAKEILAVRSTTEDSSFNFMSNKIPGGQNNPLNYFENWSKAFKAMQDAAKGKGRDKNKIAYEDYYNIITELGNLSAQMGGKGIQLGKDFEVNATNVAQMIEKGAAALSVTADGSIKVDLSKLGIDFAAGSKDLKQNVGKGIQAIAKSQVDMLDSMIALLETIVAMEALGDVDANGDMKITLPEIAIEGETHIGEDGLAYITKFTNEYKIASNKIIETFTNSDNEQLQTALDQVKVNGHTMKEILSASEQDLEDWHISADQMTKIVDGLYQLSLSDNYNVDDVWNSFMQIFSGIDFGDAVISVNATGHEIVLQNGGDYSINWDSVQVKSNLEKAIKNNATEYKTTEELQTAAQEAWEKYKNNETLTIDDNYTLSIVTGEIRVTQDKDNNLIYSVGGKAYPSKEAAAQAAALVRAGANAKDVIEVPEDEGETTTYKSKLKIGSEEIEIISDKDGNITYHAAGGEYTSREEAIKALAAEDLGITYNQVTDDQLITYKKKIGVIVDPLIMLAEDTSSKITKEVQDKVRAALDSGDGAQLEQINKDYNLGITFNPKVTENLGSLSADELNSLYSAFGIESKTVSLDATVTASGNANLITLIDEGSIDATIETQVNKDTAEVDLEDLKEKVEVIDELNPTITIDAQNNATSVIDQIQEAINNLHGKTVQIQVEETVSEALGNLGLSKGTIGQAQASGTLMGELGPELVVSQGRYFVVGQGGPEFVNLADDAIVFNHLQTQSLLEKGMSTSRGKAVTNERKAVAFAQGNINGGPAMSSASSALAVLKQLRAQWNAILNMTAQDFAALGGSGGGGGGGGNKAFIKELEKWYNWLQRIATLEKEINYEEARRNRITSEWAPNGEEYYQSQVTSYEALQEQLAVQQDLTQSQEAWFNRRREEMNATNNPFTALYTFDSHGQIQYGEGMYEQLMAISGANDEGKPNRTPEQQYHDILALNPEFANYMQYDSSGNPIEEGDYAAMVQAFWDKIEKDKEEMQSTYDAVEEGYQQLQELAAQQNEILREMRDNQIELEQKVYDAIVEIRQRMIDELTDTKDAIKDSNDKFIKGLSDALTKEQNMYNNAQSQRSLDQLRRRRDILMRSGGSAAEIASLNEQIADQERSVYFDKQQEQIDAIQEASDKQIEKLEAQIQLETELLEYQKKYGLLWAEVTDIMSQSPEQIADFIAQNTESYWNQSPVHSEESMNQLLFGSEQWAAYRDGGVIYKDIEYIAHALGHNSTETTENNNSSEDNGTEGTGTDTNPSADENSEEQKPHGGIKSSKYKADGAKGHYWIAEYNDGTTFTSDLLPHEFPATIAGAVCKKCKYKIEAHYTPGDTGSAETEEIPSDEGIGNATKELQNMQRITLDQLELQALYDSFINNMPNPLANLLSSYNNAYQGLSPATYDSISNTSNSTIRIDKVDVNLNVDELANDYDSRQAANTIMDEMLRIASKTKANNSVRR